MVDGAPVGVVGVGGVGLRKTILATDSPKDAPPHCDATGVR